MNEYWNWKEQKTIITIDPSEYYITKKNKSILIRTILGSCVSVCLIDTVAEIVGMNHFLTPSLAIYATELILDKILELGAKKINSCAKVFGGGRVLRTDSQFTIPQDNVSIIINWLQEQNIPIVKQNTGGTHGRTLTFEPYPPYIVRVKKIQKSQHI